MHDMPQQPQPVDRTPGAGAPADGVNASIPGLPPGWPFAGNE